jgi:hypothetical protein
VTDTLKDVVLSRPEPATDTGPLDGHFYDLVEARFRRIVADNPLVGTYVGIHTEDHRLGDGTRDPASDSRGISRSTTSGAASSIARSSGPGSGGRRRSTSSATRCSSSSPRTSRRSTSGST